MSDTDQVDTEQDDSPFVAPDGADDEPEPDDDDDAAAPEPEAAPEQAPEAGTMSEKDLEAAHKKIERARTTFHNRVSEIMGADANALVECPACSYFIPGMIFPQEFSPEVKAQLWPFMGLPNPNERAEAKDRHRCEDCAGWGQVQTGSLVPEYAMANCRACQGRGFVDTALPMGGNGAAGDNGAASIAADAAPMPEDPAWIQAARERGYTIVPPFQGTPGG